MSKILILTGLIWTTNLFGQSDSTLFKIQIEKQFSYLDTTKVKTGYLLNKSPFIDLNRIFDTLSGDLKHKTYVYTKKDWRVMYSSLYNACFKIKNVLPRIDSIPEFNKDNFDKTKPIVPIGIINFQANYLEGNKKGAEKIRKARIHAVSPLFEEVFNGDVTFDFAERFYFSNISKKFNLKRFEVDFGDGQGFRKLTSLPQQILISYESAGEKSLCFRFLRNNDTIVCYSKINILSLKPIKPDLEFKIETQPSIYGQNQTIQNLRMEYNIPVPTATGGTASVILGCDNVLNKPIIVAEGFDPDNSYSVDNFNKWFQIGGALSGGYLTSNNVLDDGYDLVFLNYSDGGADIRQNAQVFKDLVKKVNDQKVGKFENVVIGVSMGGLVARYGLDELENEGYKHNTGLFISFDSPQQGANVPVGFQTIANAFPISLALTLADLFGVDGTSFITAGKNAKAAKQMLIRYQGSDPSGDYNDFMNDIKTKGYPRYCKSIALVNGSNTGTKQWGGNAGDRILNIDTWVPVPIFPYAAKFEARVWSNGENVSNWRTSQVKIDFVETYAPTSNFDGRCFDIAPGGSTSMTSYPGHESGKDNFGFVPLVSSIDLKSPENSNLYYFDESTSDRNTLSLVNSNRVPFDDIYSNNQNSSHTFLLDTEGNLASTLSNLVQNHITRTDVKIQNRQFNGESVIEASTKISVGNNVVGRGRQGAVLVKNSGKVTFRAPTVDISGEFYTEDGSEFEMISSDPLSQPCSVSANNLPLPVIDGQSNYAYCSQTGEVKPALYTYKVSNLESYGTNPSVVWKISPDPTDNIGDYVSSSSELSFPYLYLGSSTTPQYTISCTINSNKTKTLVVNVARYGICPWGSSRQEYVTTDPASDSTFNSSIYPNPAGNQLKMTYSIPEKGDLKISLKNTSGILITTFYNFPNHPSGLFTITANIESVPSGLYFIEIEYKNKIYNKKLIIIK